MAKTRTEELPHVMIFGTRTFADYRLLESKMERYTADLGEIVVVTGEWRGVGYGTPNYVGADLLGEQWASGRKFLIRRFEPPFEDFPRGSPAPFHVRNRAMVEFMASLDAAYAVGFWDGRSPGSAEVIGLLKKHRVTFKLVRY
jgi:hypothetical protein